MSLIKTQVLAAIRARLALAYPTAADVSGETDPVAADRCPAYAVRSETRESERLGMGEFSGLAITEDVTVSAWAVGGPDLETLLLEFAEEMSLQVTGHPDDLGGLVEWIERTGEDVETVKGERRVGRLDLSFDVKFLDIPDPNALSGFSSGFSLGFR